MVEFRHRRDFEEWLKALPKERQLVAARVLSLRAALRVLPLTMPRGVEHSVEDDFRMTIGKRLAFVSCRASSLALAISLMVVYLRKESVQAAALATKHTAAALDDSFHVAADATRYAAAAIFAANAPNAAVATSFAVAARAAMAAVDDDAALSADAGEMEADWSKATDIVTRPLWLVVQPDWAQDATARFLTKLQNAGNNWDVWARWYQDRLDGVPPDPDFILAIARIPEADWDKGPAHVNAIIKRLEEARKPPGTPEAPEVPAQAPGTTWQRDPETGEFSPAFSVTAISPKELADLGAQRPFLLECVNDLEAAVNASRSNAVKECLPLVEAYRSALEGPLELLSIDAIYNRGLRLRNRHERLRRDEADEAGPIVTADIGEAFDSVNALHGPFILATARGTELDRRAREHNRSKQQELEYKKRAEAFANKAVNARQFLSPAGKEELRATNDNLGEGTHPERNQIVAETTNNNLLASAGLFVVEKVGGSVLGTAFVMTAPGKVLVGGATMMLDPALAFLIAAAPEIRALAAVSGESLAWIEPMYRWLEAKAKAYIR